MKKDKFAVIIAGGKGERLWPISTSKNPKPFINIFEKSLIELTYERLLKIFYKENIFFIVPKSFKKLIKKFVNEENVIFEPEGKNTFPACIYSTHFIRNLNKKAKIGIFPADHLIKKEEEFIKAIENGFEICEKGFIITFGVSPNRPETGYGYIEIGERINEKEPFIYKVEKFHEKPPLEIAKRYLEEKKFFWNSGIFLWDSNFFFEEIKNLRKEVYELYEETLLKKKNVKEFYKKIEANSIDYGLLEHSKNIAC
ncbi:MAG: mannose-1-phosphate guanylyltransferase, partial [candidate division WOR-3 bacterium]